MRTRNGLLALATAALAAATLAPTAATAQTPYRGACDLLDEAAVSDIAGTKVTALRDGSRTQCAYEDKHGDKVLLVWLHPDATLAAFQGEGAKDVTIGGLQGVSMSGGAARVVLEVPEGGLLDVGAGLIGAKAKKQLSVATGLAEGILAGGPVAAIPPDKGVVDRLYVVATMCDALAVEDVNTITSGSFISTDQSSEGERCYYLVPDGPGSLNFGLTGDVVDSRTVDAGTYDSEDLTVAGRPAIWEPRPKTLTVDAGPGRLFEVEFALEGKAAGDATSDERRDQAVAVAEGVIANLTTDAPPPPPLPAVCTLTLEEASQALGVAVDTAQASGENCLYTSTASPGSGAVFGIFDGDEPGAFLKSQGFTKVDQLPTVDVAGRAAPLAEVNGAYILVVDLDGTPGGDGKVLAVNFGGLPEGADPQAVAKALAEPFIARR